ncbi:cytochrome c oxidase subunit I [Culex quinquefasciatus]|uniref:Cytochrome c oxidase subunit I n=1 Tax=Culex quinquefasciatus TaxID=7176 RepID=B0XBD1_CULQU|nr:cytochrome c oxidase subunit I [Culex quinquefasciatus]|eukprot:XP_001866953.1 cytochrome c oxidase subunit I [Culex quinquefasciatus]
MGLGLDEQCIPLFHLEQLMLELHLLPRPTECSRIDKQPRKDIKQTGPSTVTCSLHEAVAVYQFDSKADFILVTTSECVIPEMINASDCCNPCQLRPLAAMSSVSSSITPGSAPTTVALRFKCYSQGSANIVWQLLFIIEDANGRDNINQLRRSNRQRNTNYNRFFLFSGNSQAITNKLQYKINNNLQAHSYPLFNGVAPRIITVVTLLPVWLVEGRTTTISHRKSETRTKESHAEHAEVAAGDNLIDPGDSTIAEPSIGSVEKQAILVEPVQYHPGPIGKYQNLLSELSLGSTNAGAELTWRTRDLRQLLQQMPVIHSGEELGVIGRGLDGLAEPKTPEKLFHVDRKDFWRYDAAGDLHVAPGFEYELKRGPDGVDRPRYQHHHRNHPGRQAARLPRKKESGGINKVNLIIFQKIPCMDKLDEKSRKKPPLNNPLIVVPSGNWRKTYVYVIHPKDCETI